MIIQNLSNAFRQTGAGFTLEWTRALVVVSARNDQIWWVIRWKVTKQTRSSCYWGSGLFYVSHTWSRNDEVACKPVETYLLSNARGWAGWRTMLRLQIQRWSLSLDLLWRPGCFLWSTWEPEFDPADHSCPWLPGLLCLETLDWWKTEKNRYKLYFREALISSRRLRFREDGPFFFCLKAWNLPKLWPSLFNWVQLLKLKMDLIRIHLAAVQYSTKAVLSAFSVTVELVLGSCKQLFLLSFLSEVRPVKSCDNLFSTWRKTAKACLKYLMPYTMLSIMCIQSLTSSYSVPQSFFVQ